MLKSLRTMTAVLAVAAGAAVALPAHAQSGVKVGILTCNVSSGWGFIFGSSKSLKCNYSPRAGVVEHYYGSITKFGIDIGYASNGVIVWAVFAPTTSVAPGALAGNYAGATASAAVGVGVGANALFGGSGKQIALQPVSLQGMTGLNVAGGIAAMELKAEK